MFRIPEDASGEESTRSVPNDELEQMGKRRAICIERCFDAYFQFDIGNKIISQREIELLRSNSNDRKFIRDFLDQIVAESLSQNNTDRLSNLLYEIADILKEIPETNCKNIVVEVILMYDRICEVLLNNLYKSNRFFIRNFVEEILIVVNSYFPSSKEWSVYLMSISENFGVSFILDLIFIQKKVSAGNAKNKKGFETVNLLNEEDWKKLHSLAINSIEKLVKNNELSEHKDLFNILFWWDSLYENKSTSKANDWIIKNIDNREVIVNCARSFFA